MFAIIKTGGKQYRIQVGDILSVEKIPAGVSQKILFNQVLLLSDDKETMIGTPYLEKAAVRAEVLENLKDDKVVVFKKKRRKQFRRTRGHRQELTKLRVDQIIPDVGSLPPEALAPEIKKPKIAPAAEKEVKAEEPGAKAIPPAEKKPVKKEAKPKEKAGARKAEKTKKAPKSEERKTDKALSKKKGK
jgi:large subunit ribosomal protein L21